MYVSLRVCLPDRPEEKRSERVRSTRAIRWERVVVVDIRGGGTLFMVDTAFVFFDVCGQSR